MVNRYIVKHIIGETNYWLVWDQRRKEVASRVATREKARKKAREWNAMDRVMSNTETPEQLKILGLVRS